MSHLPTGGVPEPPRQPTLPFAVAADSGTAETGQIPSGQQAVFSYEPPSSLLKPRPDERNRQERSYIEYRDTVLRPDIRKRGIQVPLLAYLEEGRKRVFDGGSRLEAALLEGLAEVPVLTYACMPSLTERSIATFLANENRLDWSAAERGRFYLETMRREGWTAAEMCRRIPGLKSARISKTLKWLENLEPEYHGLVGEGETADGKMLIPERAAYTICLFPAEERKDLCEKFLAGLLTVELLEDRWKKRKAGKKPSGSGSIKFTCAGISGVITGNPLESLRALAAKLAELFKRVEREPALADPEVLPSLLKS